VIDGCIWLIENTHFADATARPTTADKLRALISLDSGAGLPDRRQIVGRQGAVQALTTGRGSILMRARSEIETNKKGDRQAIVVTEIPTRSTSQVDRADRGARTREDHRRHSDLRDESDRDGMRIVIELKRGEMSEVVLNNLYKHTQLQMSFGIITASPSSAGARRS
jgi:DNA gyrase subunit A